MLKVLHNLTMLSFEAQTVIGLRLLKFAGGGPAADAEALRMVTEKISAAIAATHALSTGRSASSVIEIYRKTVKDNTRRLMSGDVVVDR
jgi:hypothetical protein